MQAEERLIHFSTELIYRPKQHTRQSLQKLYFDLSQTRAAYDSTDFSHPGHVRFYSKRPPRTESTMVILPDRVVLVEEWAEITLPDFCEKMSEVSRRILSDLAIPQIRAQSVTLRATFALTHFADAREFLLDHICHQANRITPYFRRPLENGGLRFVLPETPEHPGALHVAIESFRFSKKEVLVEVKGIFAREAIDLENIERAVERAHLCREFIRESVFPFLDQYDTRHEDPVQ